MKINIFEVRQVSVIKVSGRIDSTNAHQLGEALLTVVNDKHTQLVLSLSGVDYMSSAGLVELVQILKQVRRASGDLRLTQLSKRVREIIEVSGLDSIIQVFDTQEDAINSY